MVLTPPHLFSSFSERFVLYTAPKRGEEIFYGLLPESEGQDLALIGSGQNLLIDGTVPKLANFREG